MNWNSGSRRQDSDGCHREGNLDNSRCHGRVRGNDDRQAKQSRNAEEDFCRGRGSQRLKGVGEHEAEENTGLVRSVVRVVIVSLH